MNRIRTIIVDDEPLARKRLRALLAGEEEFEVVAECGNGEQAVEAIESMEPDLVFLDIRMPGMDGFDVLRNLSPGRFPLVVFVTAYDRYAVQAFEVRALDYLLKPFDADRFAETLERVRGRLGSRRDRKPPPELREMLEVLEKTRAAQDRLLVKTGGRIFFVPMDGILWIEAAGNYVHVHTERDVYLMRMTMAGMEGDLPPARFVRVHRSAMVNLEKIRELVPLRKGDFKIVLLDGREIPLGRKYRAALEKRLGRPL